jgi:hypothetical protein
MMIRQTHRKGRANASGPLFADFSAGNRQPGYTNNRAGAAEAANSAVLGQGSEQCEKPRERRKNRLSIMARGLRQFWRKIVFGVWSS